MHQKSQAIQSTGSPEAG